MRECRAAEAAQHRNVVGVRQVLVRQTELAPDADRQQGSPKRLLQRLPVPEVGDQGQRREQLGEPDSRCGSNWWHSPFPPPLNVGRLRATVKLLWQMPSRN